MQKDTSPGKHTGDFSRAMLKDAGYKRRGLYWYHIKNFLLPYYSRERIYIVIQERMFFRTAPEMRKLFSFLGVVEFSLNSSVVSFDSRNKPMSVFRRWSTGYPPIDGKLRKRWMRFYGHDIDGLQSFLGYRIQEWEA